MKQLAINIKAMRKKRKITQAQLADYCKVTGAAVSQWESSTNPSSPDLNNLLSMAKLFKVPIEVLAKSEDIENYSIERTEVSLPLIRKVFDTIGLSKQSKSFNDSDSSTKTLIFTALYGLLHNKDSRDLTADLVIMKALHLAAEEDEPDDE